jgi:choline/glycine/proline betaine transport protein
MRGVKGPVFFPAAGLVIVIVLLGILFTDSFETFISGINNNINSYFGWFLIFAVSLFLFFSIFLMFSKYGKIRLSPDESKPKYSFLSWLAMLFSAGMGIGLMFYGVAEPVLHYADPPMGTGQTVEAAKIAMDISFLHWGFHAWATYIIIGLTVSYFSYRKGYPFSIRYVFYPLFGKRIYGTLGDVIDIFAILGTLFGVSTSLGLGAMQINSGLNVLFNIPEKAIIQVIIIAIVSLIALGSVVSGINKGVKWLSIFNITLGGFLLLIILILGPTVFILKAFIENIGHFLQNFFSISLWNNAFVESTWQNKWTIFYWSWWIAWSPYVGLFIARISKGRTIREFIAAVLIIPSVFSFIWLTVFGATGIYFDLHMGSSIVTSVQDNITTALYDFLYHFPFAQILSGLATIVIVTFFVTSSDSGSYVMDLIASGGDPNHPVYTKIFWALLTGIVASVLLIGGGLIALQTATICMGLPFAVIMILICISFHKALRLEKNSK